MQVLRCGSFLTCARQRRLCYTTWNLLREKTVSLMNKTAIWNDVPDSTIKNTQITEKYPIDSHVNTAHVRLFETACPKGRKSTSSRSSSLYSKHQNNSKSNMLLSWKTLRFKEWLRCVRYFNVFANYRSPLSRFKLKSMVTIIKACFNWYLTRYMLH